MKDVVEQIFQTQHRLTSRERAGHILRSLCAQHELLAVMPNGEGEEYGSMILEVDADGSHLILDVFTPARPLAHLLDGEPFLCVARFRGIHVGFQVSELHVLDWRGAQAYRVNFPGSIYYLQRRQFYRVPTDPRDIGAVTLRRKGAAALQGMVHDISAGGMGVLVAEPGDFDLHEGEILESVEFFLQGQAIALAATVEHVGAPLHAPGGVDLVSLGLSFAAPPPAMEKLLLSYVQKRDRELLASR